MFVMSIVYVWYLVGPMALLGCVIILLFYPLMVRISFELRQAGVNFCFAFVVHGQLKLRITKLFDMGPKLNLFFSTNLDAYSQYSGG